MVGSPAKEVQVVLKFVTPAFIAGYDNRNSAEFRISSLKGLLRFWWRAYQNFSDTTELYDNESRIFGNTERRSKVSISLRSSQQLRTEQLSNLAPPIGYLGYGPIIYDNNTRLFKTARPCISSNQVVELQFNFNSDKDEMISVYNALWLLTHLGGIGSRSRRGFGSMQCSIVKDTDSELELIVKSKTVEEFRGHLESGFKFIFAKTKPSHKGGLPAFSSFSSHAKVYIFNQVFKDWQSALQAIGQEFLNYRSNRPHQLITTIAGKDYSLVCGPSGFMSTQSISSAPMRLAFGLPHNYFSSSRKRGGTPPFQAEFVANLGDEDFARRASPLIFHVAELEAHQSGINQCCIVITWLRSQFLPVNAGIKAVLPPDRPSGFTGKEIPNLNVPSDQAISDFLAQMQKRERLINVNL